MITIYYIMVAITTLVQTIGLTILLRQIIKDNKELEELLKDDRGRTTSF